jgi:uncharacterized membrane protein YdbT with pleckstrin-like domain
MALSDYIGPNETIQLSFRKGLWYTFLKILVTGAIFGSLAWFYRENIFFWAPVAFIGGFIILLIVLDYWAVVYFITEKKIYKKTGFLARKVVSAKKEEISNMKTRQGVADRFLFFVGDIEFWTETIGENLIILQRVQSPYTKEKQIQTIWS